MRYFLTTLALTGLLAASAAHADTMANCSSAWKAKAPAATAAGTYQAWSKQCLAKSYAVPSATPAASAAPAGATGQCKDGTYTLSKTHQGACSSHGGVAKWL